MLNKPPCLQGAKQPSRWSQTLVKRSKPTLVVSNCEETKLPEKNVWLYASHRIPLSRSGEKVRTRRKKWRGRNAATAYCDKEVNDFKQTYIREEGVGKIFPFAFARLA